MTDGAGRHYTRIGDIILDSETTCTPESCDQEGCTWPDCSVDVRRFTVTKDADRYQHELELLGNEVTT